MPALVAAGVLLAGALAAGCGGDEEPAPTPSEGNGGAGGEETEPFEPQGFDVTFQRPADFEPVPGVEFNRSAGTEPDATAAVGIDDENLIAVQRFDLRTRVTDDNLRTVREELDELFGELAGTPVTGEETEVAGLPAVEYRVELDEPPDAQTRAVAIFDGQVEYLLNCQSLPDSRDRIEDACELAMDTFQVE